MRFKEFLYLSLSGSGLISSSSSVYFPNGSSNSINERKGKEGTKQVLQVFFPSDQKQDYKSYVRHNIKKSVVVTPKNESGNYILYPLKKELDFSLEFNPTEQDLLDFPIKDVSIRLFVDPVWSDADMFDDKYDFLSSNQVQELFKNRDEAKLKRLLLSLSSRRDWIRLRDKTYTVIGEVAKPEKVSDLSFYIKIKYFKTFEALKNYIDAKLKTCHDFSSCEVKDMEELEIIDQDKLSFFTRIA